MGLLEQARVEIAGAREIASRLATNHHNRGLVANACGELVRLADRLDAMLAAHEKAAAPPAAPLPPAGQSAGRMVEMRTTLNPAHDSDHDPYVQGVGRGDGAGAV